MVPLMKSKKCSKCSSTEIFSPQTLGIQQGNVFALKLPVWSSDDMCKKTDFICLKCGFVETYITDEDLKKLRQHAKKS